MSVRGTVVLAVVLAGMIAYLFATAPRHNATTPLGVEPLVPPALRPTSILVRRGDLVLFESTRSQSGWNDPRVDDFMAALASLPVIAVIEETTTTPLAYGFRPDAVRLRLQAEEGALIEIEVGGPNPAGTGVYVRRSDGSAVLLTGSLLRWELEKLRSVPLITAEP